MAPPRPYRRYGTSKVASLLNYESGMVRNQSLSYCHYRYLLDFSGHESDSRAQSEQREHAAAEDPELWRITLGQKRDHEAGRAENRHNGQ
jgi:hypothetical protein